jgi:hypothetical protein
MLAELSETKDVREKFADLLLALYNSMKEKDG